MWKKFFLFAVLGTVGNCLCSHEVGYDCKKSTKTQDVREKVRSLKFLRLQKKGLCKLIIPPIEDKRECEPPSPRAPFIESSLMVPLLQELLGKETPCSDTNWPPDSV